MAETVAELLDRLLDRRYDAAAVDVLKAVGVAVDSPRVRTALAELEAEADRLRRLNLPLQPDNPALRNAAAEIDAAMRAAAEAVAGAADQVAGDALKAAETLQRALPAALGVPRRILVGWNVVSADALAQLVAFQRLPGWAARLASYAGAPTALIDQIVLRGFAIGRSPLAVARDVALATQAVPRSHANIMLRTLYLQTYKRAAAAAQSANRQIITRVRRMATIDNRTCVVCIALHGTEIPIGEAPEMHEQCRCVAVSDVAGFAPVFGPTGPEWFAGLDDAMQRAVMGAGAWEAWKAGAIDLGDVVGRYEDDLYGTMLRQRSLREMVGDDRAAAYIAQARRWRAPLTVEKRA